MKMSMARSRVTVTNYEDHDHENRRAGEDLGNANLQEGSGPIPLQHIVRTSDRR